MEGWQAWQSARGLGGRSNPKKNDRAIEMCQSEDRAGSDFPKLKGRGGCLKSPKRIMVGGRG